MARSQAIALSIGECDMTPEEKFMFDLDGYLVIKDVLSQRGIGCAQCGGG